MIEKKYERVYALSQKLLHVCEEVHMQMNMKRKEREAWRKNKEEITLSERAKEEGRAKGSLLES